MAEWVYEAGIGEARAALIEGGAIIEAMIEREDGALRAGTIADARLIEIIIPGKLARLDIGGGEALLDGIPAGASTGRTLRVRIIREAIPEAGRPKCAKAVAVADDEPICAGPSLLARISSGDAPVRPLHPHESDALEAAGWSEVIEAAESGEIAFPGGALRMAVTPAMTLFDVDGSLAPLALATAAAIASAHTIRQLGIGGSIGIDFPGLPDKAARNAVAAAFDAVMPQPYERTAINGFGFMQIVRRRERPSLPELLHDDPVGAALRAAMRRMEREPPGQPPTPLPPALRARLEAEPDWAAMLARRTGRRL